MADTTPTIGAVTIPVSVEISPGEVIDFHVWDTAGQDDFRCVLPMFIRGAGVAVVCFDLTSRSSFSHLKD
jgi:GTPase SAR1 family protein